MRGTVKYFNNARGYGFIYDLDGKEIFVHQSSINMDGFRSLHADDIVQFEIGAGKNGREQAVNVTPIITMKVIKAALGKDGLYVKKPFRDAYGVKKYHVVNADNLIQNGEQGMTFEELADWAEIKVEEN